jgi:hypothetical protein
MVARVGPGELTLTREMVVAQGAKSDLALSEIWYALDAAGAQVYQCCESGAGTGAHAIRIGPSLALVCDGANGFSMAYAPDDAGLVPVERYDGATAERAASDTAGYFGVVGRPESAHHSFEWCVTEAEAEAWVDRRLTEVLEAHPALGAIEAEVVSAAEAFDRTYRDGRRVYFRRREAGAGFEPRRRGD